MSIPSPALADLPAPLPPQLAAALSARFPDGSPGAALGIIQHGRSYVGAVGLAARAPAIAFAPTTRFRACSITKQFVALLLLQLEAEGRLSLDDSPGRYVSELSRCDPTLRLWHLAQNRSGLPDYWCAAMLIGAEPETPFSLAAGRELILRLQTPMFPPGSGTRYSNGNFRILQWVLESVTGESLATLLQTRIFGPLGMRDTSLGEDTAQPLPDGTRGYRRVGEGWEEEVTRIVWSGDAGLVTTMVDLLRWEAALLGGGPVRLPQAERLPEARLRPDGSRASYAYGVNSWRAGERSMQWHSGALRGFRMMHLRFPEDATAVVVFLNRTENPMPHALAFARELGLEPAWDVPTPTGAPTPDAPAAPSWPVGAYHCPALDLLAELGGSAAAPTLNLGMDAQPLIRQDPQTLISADGFTRLELRADGVQIESRSLGFRRPFDRLSDLDIRSQLAGRRFRSPTLESVAEFSADGHALSFAGAHGRSRSYALRSLGGGLLAFDCPRALDEPPPGRFHLRLDGDTLQLACLLAGGPALRFTSLID